jgi:hypothetical protein
VTKKTRYPGLTKEQRTQLKALLAEIDTMPTPEAIVACREAMGADLDTDEGVKLADQSMAGAWAAERIIPYLLELRELNARRLELGKTIYHHQRHPDPEHESEVVGKAQAEVFASHLSGSQEVIFNLICICVKHIRSFLKIAAESVNYTIDPDDLEFLDTYRHLRNHYEHMYNRLPGKTNELALLVKDISDGTYRVQGGLDVDSAGNILVVELKAGVATTHAVAVTQAGMQRIESIVQETWRNLKRSAVKQVRQHFIADPSNIPSPASLTQGMLFRAGGYTPPLDEDQSQSS